MIATHSILSRVNYLFRYRELAPQNPTYATKTNKLAKLTHHTRQYVLPADRIQVWNQSKFHIEQTRTKSNDAVEARSSSIILLLILLHLACYIEMVYTSFPASSKLTGNALASGVQNGFQIGRQISPRKEAGLTSFHKKNLT